MAHYAIPRYVEFVDALPKTETHRIQYATLKAQGITPETWDREAVGIQGREGLRSEGRGGACATSTSPERA